MAKSPFLESVHTEIRTKQYSYRTEQTYLWVCPFILFNDKRHPEVMGNHEIENLQYKMTKTPQRMPIVLLICGN